MALRGKKTVGIGKIGVLGKAGDKVEDHRGFGGVVGFEDGVHGLKAIVADYCVDARYDGW